MKKTNHSSRFMARLSRYLLVFCMGCLAFATAIGQPNDSGTVPATTNSKENKAPAHSTSCCNLLFIGPSTIVEDSYKPFNTYGPTVAFTHPVTGKLGIAGNAGIYFGSQNGVDYTKFQVLGGLSLLPNDNSISFSPHLLAGISSVNSKYKLETMSFSNHSSGLSIAAGTDVSFPINNKTRIALKADYNPTFSSGGTKNNFLFGLGINLNAGCKKNPAVVTTGDVPVSTYAIHEKKECNASSLTKEMKISFTALEKIAESIEKIGNKIPRLEIKVAIKPELNVKRGEECCSKDKPPVTYTELRGGVTGSMEININFWGLPDIKYEVTVWPYRIVADFQCKAFGGSTADINVEGAGKFYGELGDHSRPDCKACWYFNIKAESTLRVGVRAGGGIYFYRWPYKNKKVADDKIEALAEATLSAGQSFAGTYGSENCTTPPAGLHGVYNIGKLKGNLKFSVELGPLSFNPNFEITIFDGIDFKF